MSTLNESKIKLEQFIMELAPDADVSPGSVLSEILVKLSSAIDNEIANDVLTIDYGNSVKDVLDSVEDTYSDSIANIASNYNISRVDGLKSTGNIRVYVSSSRNYFIRKGFEFYQPNLNLVYVSSSDVNVSVNPSGTDISLQESNGIYSFVVGVEASDTGVDYQLTNGTKLSLGEGSVLTNFIEAKVIGGFSSGLKRETDKELITRFSSGIASRTLLSPDSILNKLREDFPTVQAISVVGSSDVEMSRCKGNFISTLGCADVYVKSSSSYATTEAIVEATKTTDTAWTFSLGNDIVGGAYHVIRIAPSDDTDFGTYEIVSQNYRHITNFNGRANLLANAEQARFTSYQVSDVVFNLDDGRSVGDTDKFLIVIAHQPYINEIQNIFLNGDTRIPCADYLVKAAVPCFVSMNIRLTRKKATDTIDVSAIKREIFNYINTIPFGEDLHVSNIVDICHNYNVKKVNLPIVVDGLILTSTSETVSISGSDRLEIPNMVDKGITKNTSLFIVEYYRQGSVSLVDNIGISVS